VLVNVRPKVLEFEASVREDGAPFSLGRPLADDGWTAEALVLAALVRCSLASLRYATGRMALELVSASGEARGTVTKRDGDGRYAFTSVEVELTAKVEPLPEGDALADLVALAERGCFVGASLTAKPEYRWRIT
jgi:uncharacterized OsmC-like protein